ncbi:dihydropteroate synthase [Aquabacterium lacunae]|uniref:Dihydropteroate synthase n=1 Tax=Aquabacterium lacunae TaxID=2528630 RepID=A0A4Q9GZT8_9BURK|nr:dihydropteroate synthase [Aquabacterium lacunae]TBO28793.1 dihydropteroate synthase [Aquabacterium lacunae]
MRWQTTRYDIDLSQPRVMGIVNVTPDSFSDGGRYLSPADALAQCEQLVREGADILDLGAESSRPGAPTLPADEEWARLAPVLKAAVTLGVPVSVDTWKTAVMRQALDAGADIINDIQALRDPGAEALVAAHGRCGVCLMHMRGDPATMQQFTQYDDVMQEVSAFLRLRDEALQAQGVAPERITLDPGVGFGKTPEQNLALLARQREFLALGRPLLVGWSRKSTLGVVTGQPVEARMPASVAAALAGVLHGARVVRVHDVAATVDALKVWRAVHLPAELRTSTPLIG